MGSKLTLAERNRLKVIKSVEKEFKCFRRSTCRRSKKQIFEASCKNMFYALTCSYFTGCDTIPDEIMNRLVERTMIIGELWQMQLLCGEFYINTWDDLQKLILLYLEKSRTVVNF